MEAEAEISNVIEEREQLEAKLSVYNQEMKSLQESLETVNNKLLVLCVNSYWAELETI